MELRNVTKDFPGVRALDNISMKFESGKIHCILGQNGAGKSTLIKILSGLNLPDAGSILYEGEPVSIRNPSDAIKLGIASVYQELLIVPNLSAAENILITSLPSLLNLHKMTSEVKGICDEIGLHVNLETPAKKLTVIQKQMLSVARALSQNARVFIFDEPSSILSNAELPLLYRMLDVLRRRDALILYVTHMVEEAVAMGDEVTVLRDGKIVFEKYRQDGINQDDVARAILGDEEYRHREELMKRKEVHKSKPDTIPSIELVNVAYQGMLREINLSIFEGEVTCLFGLEGSGKTELAKILGGQLQPTDGVIKLEGTPVKIRSPHEALMRRVSTVQTPAERKEEGLLLSKNIKDNTILSSFKRVLRAKTFIDSRKVDGLTNKYVRDFRIVVPSATAPVANLSGGNQQKILLARAFASGARIMILLDPTRGLDIGAKSEIIEIVRASMKDKTVIVVPSELSDALLVADRIIVFREGKIVWDGYTDERLANASDLLESAGFYAARVGIPP